MKKNEIKFIMVLVAITVIVAVMWAIRHNGNKNKVSANVQTDLIDVNDEAYAGKKIYEQDGDIIIENEDGGKTIETTKGEPTDLKQLNTEEKGQYVISDVKVDVQGSRTKVTGNVKNNTKVNHKVNVQIKFYDSSNRVKGVASTIIESVKAGETKQFEMNVMGNMQGYTYKAEVTYTN